VARTLDFGRERDDACIVGEIEREDGDSCGGVGALDGGESFGWSKGMLERPMTRESFEVIARLI
jgi:hypothetical protein